VEEIRADTAHGNLIPPDPAAPEGGSVRGGDGRPAVGIDGYRHGWVAVRADEQGLTWATAGIPAIGDLVPAGVVVGIDMPIGLVAAGERECDALARRALPGAASRVFTTPPRAVLELGPNAPNAEVQALSRLLMGKGVSRQALHLAPRILALDAHLARLPAHRAVEVHPELSFTELAGRVLTRKKSSEGSAQRLDALEAWLRGVRELVATRPSDVPLDDALDALAALWTAQRWRDGRARTLPAAADAPPRIVI